MAKKVKVSKGTKKAKVARKPVVRAAVTGAVAGLVAAVKKFGTVTPDPRNASKVYLGIGRHTRLFSVCGIGTSNPQLRTTGTTRTSYATLAGKAGWVPQGKRHVYKGNGVAMLRKAFANVSK